MEKEIGILREDIQKLQLKCEKFEKQLEKLSLAVFNEKTTISSFEDTVNSSGNSLLEEFNKSLRTTGGPQLKPKVVKTIGEKTTTQVPSTSTDEPEPEKILPEIREKSWERPCPLKIGNENPVKSITVDENSNVVNVVKMEKTKNDHQKGNQSDEKFVGAAASITFKDDLKPFKCTICGLGCRNLSELRNHKKEH